jgi:hypothetical protein
VILAGGVVLFFYLFMKKQKDAQSQAALAAFIQGVPVGSSSSSLR